MKLVLLAAAAASSLALPAMSRTGPTDPIVIQGSARAGLAQWKRTVSREIERNLFYPHSYPGWEVPEGTVAVRFSCDGDGKPTAIELSRSSGHRRLDGAAMRAVRRISTLHPLPPGISEDATLRANVIFASDETSLARQEKALRHEEARLAERARREGRQVVVLDTGHRIAG